MNMNKGWYNNCRPRHSENVLIRPVLYLSIVGASDIAVFVLRTKSTAALSKMNDINQSVVRCSLVFFFTKFVMVMEKVANPRSCIQYRLITSLAIYQ